MNIRQKGQGWLLAMAAGIGAAASVCPGEPRVILDENAYWREYLHGGPARVCHEPLKAEGEAIFGEKSLRRLRQRVMRRLEAHGIETDDWRKEVRYVPGAGSHHYRNLRMLNYLETTPPRAGWMKADFDDGDWTWQRKPFKMGKDFHADGFVDHFFQIKTTYFRTTFEVADPARAGDLELRLAYRGGVRAFLNGEEIARRHLPAGAVGPETPAEPYPPEAYWALPGEYPPELKAQPKAGPWFIAGKHLLVPDIGVFARRGVESFDDAEKTDKVEGPYRRARAMGYGGRCYMNRKGWQRIIKLRDRRLNVPIPAHRLRAGTNVLALEVHTSELHPAALRWWIPWQGNCTWKHGWLLDVRLRGEGKGIPPPTARPPGVQVWVVDPHHRLFAPDFHPPGPLPQRIRLVAARNGTYAAQIAVGTDRKLEGLAAAVSDFRGPGGASLPSAIATVRYMVGHPSWEIGSGKALGAAVPESMGNVRTVHCWAILDRYTAADELVRAAGDEQVEDMQQRRAAELRRIGSFDHVAGRAPESVPAGTCQPLWISVSVRGDARPGTYRAAVTVSADGAEPVELPVELQVLDWRVPDPRDFRTVVAFDQSPYSVARHYRVEPWSDEHLRLMEPSYELLATVGNDFVIVPVIAKTEFGNSEDSPVEVIREADGTLRLDFAKLDRYLDLALRHWPNVRCIAFVMDHSDPQVVEVCVTDERTGRRQFVDIGKDAPNQRRRQFWRLLAGGIARHMASRGLRGRTYWGLHGDGVNDPSIVKLLAEFAPDVTWVRYSHRNTPNAQYTWCATVRVPGQFLAPTSRKGWKTPRRRMNMWVPRSWNGIAVLSGPSGPFAFRLGIEHALAAGAPGMAHAGSDYWDDTWLHDFPKRPYCGLQLLSVLWPGPDGAESSARFEMFREGVQETEARIFLEQAVEKLGDEKLARDITALLDDRLHDTLFTFTTLTHPKIEEYTGDWQVRSRKLYHAAARVGSRLGLDLARNKVAVDVPARGSREVKLRIRSWTSGQRAWKLSADKDWLRPRRTAGTTRGGAEDLTVTVLGTELEPGEAATGTLRLTEVRSGRVETAAVTARVSPVFGVTADRTVANLDCGAEDEVQFTLANPAAEELDWELNVSAPWAVPEPGRGKLAPGRQQVIRLALKPPDRTRAVHRLDLLFTEADGAERSQTVTVHVIPPRRAEAKRPAGKAVPARELPGSMVARALIGGRAREPGQRVPSDRPRGDRPWAIGRKTPEAWDTRLKTYKTGLMYPPGSEVTLSIEGKAFEAFSAEVGWYSLSGLGHEPREKPRLHFEIYVDGKLADHSGMMWFTDPPRLLVADVRGAKRIRLVTRLHNDELNEGGRRVWGLWGEPVFHARR